MLRTAALWCLASLALTSCAIDGEEAAPPLDGDGGGGGGKADESDPAEILAELTDPARPSAPYECMGPPLTRPELVAMFRRGAGVLRVGLDSSSDFQALEISRVCAPLSGCSAWGERASDAKSLAFQLYFEGASTASLSAISYDRYWSTFDADSKVGVDEGDIVLIVGGIYLPRRVLITRASPTEVCVSVATTVNQSGSPQSYETFFVGRGTLTVPAAGSAVSTEPSFTGFGQCGPGEPSTTALANAWLSPGSVGVSLVAKPTTCREAQRFCHSITGCSQWAYTASCTGTPVATGISVAQNQTALVVGMHLGNAAGSGEVASGAFSSTIHAWQNTGLLSTSCVGWSARLDAPNATSPAISADTYQRRSVGRINR